LPVIPVDQIPPRATGKQPQLDYQDIREQLEYTHPRKACVIAHGLTPDEARSLVQVIKKGEFFACRRSRNLQPQFKSVAVYAGWCLPEDEILKAKGKA
jgi:hypothetical protein